MSFAGGDKMRNRLSILALTFMVLSPLSTRAVEDEVATAERAARNPAASPTVTRGTQMEYGPMLCSTLALGGKTADRVLALKGVIVRLGKEAAVCFDADTLRLAAGWTGALASLRQALVPLMVWRGLGNAGNSLCFQAALARMPLADAMGILQLTPLCLTAASALLLGARVGWRRWTAVAAGLVGALLVIKPGSSTFNAWAILAVLSVLCGTFRDISSRRFHSGLSPLVILIGSQSIVGLCALAGLVFERWVLPDPLVMLQLGAGALFIAGGHLFALNAVRHSDLAVVAPFRYAGIVWAIAFGFALWGDVPDALSLAGIAILISAGLYTFHRERQSRIPAAVAPGDRPRSTEPS